MKFSFNQKVGQLEKRRGGYYYLKVNAEIVDQFEKKRKTRFICEIDQKIKYSCGLNHYGDGNFFIILSTANLKKLGKHRGNKVSYTIYEDPNPLGVEIPEVLSVLLEQDEILKNKYDVLTDGKKRSLIFTINKVKNIDLQVEKALKFFENIN